MSVILLAAAGFLMLVGAVTVLSHVVWFICGWLDAREVRRIWADYDATMATNEETKRANVRAALARVKTSEAPR